MDVVPDVNSSMASALDILLISLSRSGDDDGNRDDGGCGGYGGTDGNYSLGCLVYSSESDAE